MKSLLNALRMLLALRCEESTRLISDGLDRELTGVERWALRLHAISCLACRRFRRHLPILHRALRLRISREEKLSAEARQRIQASLRDLQ